MQKTLVNIDINTRSQITQTGEFVNRSADYVRIERASWSVLCFQFYDRQITDEGGINLVEYPITSNSFILLGDNDFDTNTEVLIKAVSSATGFDSSNPLTTNAFNLTGDWIDGSTADPTKGQISVRIYSGTTRLNQLFNANPQPSIIKDCYLSLRQQNSDLNDTTPLVWIPFIPYNTVLEEAPASIDVPDADVVAQALLGYFTRPFLFQYSADNSSWHDTLQSTDSYMRMRMGNADDAVSQVWSLGYPGVTQHTYIRYAEDDEGTGYTDTPNANTYYIGIISTYKSESEISVSDFNGKWYKARSSENEPLWQSN